MTDRRPEIDAYLRQNADRYTPDALRAALIDAGHDPREVDAALADWRARGMIATEERGLFWRYTWLFHGLALVVVVVLVAVSGDSIMRGVWPIVAIILGIVLLAGVALSGLIGGRLLIPRAGLAWGLVVPAASALLIGGSCYAMTGGFATSPDLPQVNGEGTLRLQQPDSLELSGPVTCIVPGDGTYAVSAEMIAGDGRVLSVSVEGYAATEPEVRSLFISLSSGEGEGAQFSMAPRSSVTALPSRGGMAGTVEFAELEGIKESGAAASQSATGSLQWECR